MLTSFLWCLCNFGVIGARVLSASKAGPKIRNTEWFLKREVLAHMRCGAQGSSLGSAVFPCCSLRGHSAPSLPPAGIAKATEGVSQPPLQQPGTEQS